MTDQSPASTDTNRDSLRARIETAERRNAERTLSDNARKAANAATDYTRAHPLTVIGGALAAGLVIGLLTRPGRKVARRVVNSATEAVSGAANSATSGVKSITARGSSHLGSMFGEAAMAYVMTVVDDLLEATRSGQERAEELGNAANAKAGKLKAGAAQAAETAADNSRSLARNTRQRAGRVVNDLKRKTKG